MVCWQMAHFYAIAIYRLKDYKKANVPVWPAKYGVASTKRQIYIFVAAFITANALLWATHYVGYIYLAVVGLSSAYWLLLAAKGFEKTTDDDVWARGLFKFSLIILLVFAGMLTIGPILP
jgi:protoheme IX farnesyltransferase